MRTDSGRPRDVRSNALWGRRGESRSNALWGKGKRGALVLTALVAVLAVPMAGASTSDDQVSAMVPTKLLTDAVANPLKTFDVVVQGRGKIKSADVANTVRSDNGKVKKTFLTITGVSTTITGKDLLKLARDSKISAITPDVKVKTSGYEDSLMWADTV